MKKGFTLVELLAVIVIIGVVALIAVPAIMGNIAESREKLFKVQIQNIELAAKKWATDNSGELDSEYLNSSYISVEMLQDLNYLSNDKLTNPSTGEIMNGCVRVSYDTENKIYTYTYDDVDTACSTKEVSGYYYKKNDDSTWERDLSVAAKESIYSYIIGENGSNVVASGPGIYDLGDRYVFRGNVTNNYVKLDGTYFRILSLDKTTKTMKLISTTHSGSAVWGTSSDNNSFNVSTLYTDRLNGDKYATITTDNVKWNIGKIENTPELNINAVRAYEGKTKIVSDVGLISMSEYMESSTNVDCSNGVLSSCALDNYLNVSAPNTIADSWTMTTTSSSVVYVNSAGELSYETDLLTAHHNIYLTLNIIPMEKSENAIGTYSAPYIITASEL